MPQAGTPPYRPPEAVDTTFERVIFGCWDGAAMQCILNAARGVLEEHGRGLIETVCWEARQCTCTEALASDLWAAGLVLGELAKHRYLLQTEAGSRAQTWRWWRNVPALGGGIGGEGGGRGGGGFQDRVISKMKDAGGDHTKEYHEDEEEEDALEQYFRRRGTHAPI